ncbi:MAG TPA: zinc-ribbon domain-containing protein, partial [Pirellulales bacterium]|nr:zinc-ribbon domain-containing protein [Pirellulales bacterium]
MSSATHAPATFNSDGAGDTLAPRGKACASCGAPVEQGDRFCNACGTPQPSTAPSGTPSPEEGAAGGAATKCYRCKNCGAETSVPLDTRSFTCPFCDSNYVVELPPAETGRQ